MLVAGCVQFGRLAAGWRATWSRLAYTVQWAVIVAGGVSFVLLVMPVATVNSALWRITSKIHDQFREQIGWPDLARIVASVYGSLSAQERETTRDSRGELRRSRRPELIR